MRLTWGFESLHPPLPLTRRLMRILGAIIEIPVLAMFYPWKKLALGGSVALELVGHDHARGIPQALQHFPEEALGRLGVASALDQDVEHGAVLVDRPP